MSYSTYQLHEAQKTGVAALAAVLAYRNAFSQGRITAGVTREIVAPLAARVFGIPMASLLIPRLAAGMDMWKILDEVKDCQRTLDVLNRSVLECTDGDYGVEMRDCVKILLSPDPGCASIELDDKGVTLLPLGGGWWAPEHFAF